MNGFLAIALALLAGWFAWRSWQDSARLTLRRAELLSSLDGILDDVVATPLPSGYRKVTGRYRGSQVTIEPIVDTLNVRKLPVLWLMVTLPGPLPIRSTFDLMMRANGLEVFSGYRELEHAVEPPKGFPEWAGVRTDNPRLMPSPDIISRYLRLFHEGTGKELLITPKGLRMVVMADQADRGGYLIFRDARFGGAAVAPDLARGILDDLLALRSDLAAQPKDVTLAS